MTANPLKAPRYRPGKVVAEEASSSEDEEDSSAETEEPTNAAASTSKKAAAPPPKATTAKGIRSDLSKVDLNERRKEAALKEAERVREVEEARRKEEEGFVTESEEDVGSGEEGSGSGSEEGSSEEESESEEEEAPRRVMIRPTFIKKSKRDAGAANAKAEEQKTEEELIEEEEKRRKAAADEIVEEQIRKDIAAREAGKKAWDDDEADEDDVDDTDDLNPEAEHAAWKLRELTRIKRERLAIETREAELAEVERRKGLSIEDRRREDDEFIAKQKEEKDGKAKAGFLQKYHHKGAFFQDDETAEILAKRDLMGAKFVDEVDNELLPKALQIRDVTKLGRKGATKYRDLKSEDTGRWGEFGDKRRDAGPGGRRGDERFMSDRDRERLGASGANNVPVGDRKVVSGAPDGPRGMSRRDGDESRDRERDGGRDGYRDRRDYRPRSRSRSPQYDSRKRGGSRERHRDDGDKRRKIDSR